MWNYLRTPECSAKLTIQPSEFIVAWLIKKLQESLAHCAPCTDDMSIEYRVTARVKHTETMDVELLQFTIHAQTYFYPALCSTMQIISHGIT